MSITGIKIVNVRVEIDRLVDALDRLEARGDFDPDAIYNQGSPETGKVRRASMDLTRALADLRRWG